MCTLVLMNTTTTTQHVLQTGKTTTYLNVQDKPRKQFGRVYVREARKGENVSVTPGKSIRLFGTRQTVRGEVRYDLTFKVGDVAVYGAFNLVYTGRIRSIGAKTVSIVDYEGTCNEKVKQLSLARFSSWNDDFDLDAINKRNSEWMD